MRYYELTQPLQRECRELRQTVGKLSEQMASSEEEVKTTQDVRNMPTAKEIFLLFLLSLWSYLGCTRPLLLEYKMSTFCTLRDEALLDDCVTVQACQLHMFVSRAITAVARFVLCSNLEPSWLM